MFTLPIVRKMSGIISTATSNPRGAMGTPSAKAGGSTNTKSQAGSKTATAASATPRDTGTYHYDTSGQTSYGQGFTQQMPSDTTLTADPAKGVTQRSVRDLRDSQGNGSVTETWLEFRSDGVAFRSFVRGGSVAFPLSISNSGRLSARSSWIVRSVLS